MPLAILNSLYIAGPTSFRGASFRKYSMESILLRKKNCKLLAFILIFVTVICYHLLHIKPPPEPLFEELKSNRNLETMENIDFNKIPKEALDPGSQFFGMTFKDTYGFSSPYDKNYRSFYEDLMNGLPIWEKLFPKVMNALHQYSFSNFNHHKKKFTSALQSSCIVPEFKNYIAGDTFKATIYARDFTGERKLYGGDYFRARLIKTTPTSNGLIDGVPLSVKDNTDGTYTVIGPLFMPGRYKLEVKLCASLEAIGRYSQWSAGRIRQGITFEATLTSNETVFCNSDLLLYDEYRGKDLCNYTNPRNMEPWFCSKPPSGKCYPITFLTPFSSSKNFKDNSYFDKPFAIKEEIPTKYQLHQNILGTDYEFDVYPKRHEAEFSTMEWIKRSVTDGSFRKNRLAPSPTGFSHNGHWVSFVRNYERHSTGLKNLAKCFDDKVVYFIGDSTMRQFFDYTSRKFKMKITQINGDKYYHVPRLGRDKKRNITLYYRAHGPPIRNPGPPSLAVYITDTINEIKVGGKKVAIILNFGLHYLEYNPNFFVHRLHNVKKALENLLQRFPETKIIIKGFNAAQLPALPFEWLIYRFDVILKETMKGLPNAVFIDLWDMTTLWPLTVDYHPPENMIEEQSYLMYSYICD